MSSEDGPSPIHRLEVPTPFPVGSVNAFLLEGRPLTLVDTGPNWARSFTALEGLLREKGYGPEDLELLVITHQHVDHLGLTALLAERSAAEVVCWGPAATWIEDYATSARRSDEYAHEQMLQHGVAPTEATLLHSLARHMSLFGGPARITRRLDDGDVLHAGGRAFHVLHRPGHSPSDIVLHDAEGRVLVAGDHLLSHTSSNALLSPSLSPNWDGRRPPALLDYRDSLRKTAELDVDLVLGGHGPPIRRHRALIAERLAAQDRRAAQLLDLLAEGPQTAYELAVKLWRREAIVQAFLTLSEVLGHLDLLIAEGVAAAEEANSKVTFEAL